MLQKFIGVFICLSLVTAQTQAVTAKPARKLKSNRSTSSSSSSETVSIRNPNSQEYQLMFGFGLPIAEGNVGWGINAGGTMRVSSSIPIYVGLDLGFSSRSVGFGVPGFGATVNGFQLLATGYYRYALNNTTHLIGGLSMGPNFGSSTVTGVSGGGSSTSFELLVRPGADFVLAQNFSLETEAKFGVVGGSFIFFPQVNALFTL